MTPYLPFVAGLALGAAAIAALRSERAKTALDAAGAQVRQAADDAQTVVRSAARSGLALLSRTSSAAAPADTAAADAAAVAAPPAENAAAPPADKPARPRRARKPRAAPAPDAPAPRRRRAKQAEVAS